MENSRAPFWRRGMGAEGQLPRNTRITRNDPTAPQSQTSRTRSALNHGAQNLGTGAQAASGLIYDAGGGRYFNSTTGRVFNLPSELESSPQPDVPGEGAQTRSPGSAISPSSTGTIYGANPGLMRPDRARPPSRDVSPDLQVPLSPSQKYQPNRPCDALDRSRRGRIWSCDLREYEAYGFKYGLRNSVWTPGSIISTPFHTPDYSSPADKPTPNRCLVYQGCWVFTKIRKFIIIQNFAHHVVAIPVYTHHGSGLQNKPAHEYVGIRDQRDAEAVKADRGFCPFPNLIAKPDVRFGTGARTGVFSGFNKDTFAHHAAPVFFSKDIYCKTEGELIDGDAEKLLRLHCEPCRKCLLPGDLQQFPALASSPMVPFEQQVRTPPPVARPESGAQTRFRQPQRKAKKANAASTIAAAAAAAGPAASEALSPPKTPLGMKRSFKGDPSDYSDEKKKKG